MKKIVCFMFYLFMTYAWAEETVIIPDVKLKSNNRLEQKPNHFVSSIRFTKKYIKKSPVINLSQFLKQEQSIVRLTHSADANQTALSIRGFGENAAANSLILIDGFPLTNPSLLAPNFNSMPLANIERMEIFPGSSGALWGDQAVGGVVNIISKHPQKFFANAILSVGSYHSYYDIILVGDKAENGLFFKIFGLIGKTDNYRDHNQQRMNNAAAQVGYDYASGTISLNIQSYGGEAFFPGGLNEQQFKQNPRQAVDFRNVNLYRTNVFQLLSKQEFNSDWLLETRLDYHETNGGGFIFGNLDRFDSQFSFHPRLCGTLFKNKVTLGYDGQRSEYRLIHSSANVKTSAQQNNLYLQTSFPVTDDIKIILGARKAWQTNRINEQLKNTIYSLDQIFVTEQGIAFYPMPALSFFIRRDGNFSFPKANEQTWLPQNVKTLQVQSGTSYEAGVEWQNEKYKTQINLYRLFLHNEIAFIPAQTVNQPFGAYNNLDKTIRDGFGVTQQIHVTYNATLHGQLNVVKARFASGPFSGNTIPSVPAINANLGFDYNWLENWRTQYNLLYTGPRFAVNDAANTGKKIQGYWLSDIALQYFLKSFIFIFEIHNLFNKQYPMYVFQSLRQQTFYYPAAGRDYLLTLKVNLD